MIIRTVSIQIHAELNLEVADLGCVNNTNSNILLLVKIFKEKMLQTM